MNGTLKRTLMYAGLAAVLTAPAFAQDSGTDPGEAGGNLPGNAGSYEEGGGIPHYNNQGILTPDTGGSPENHAIGTQSGMAPSAAPQTAQIGAGHFLASNLIGKSVRNTNGETVGEVDDLVISNNGNLDGVVVSVGDFLGMGAKRVGLDLRQLQPADDNSSLITPVTRDQLAAAPDFSQQPVMLR